MSALCEDGRSIAPWVRVGEIDGLLKGIDADNLHDWSEDFLLVAVNASAHVIDDCWANPVAIGVSLNLHTTAVEKELAIVLTILDQTMNLLKVLSVVHRTNVSIVPASTNRHLFGFFNDLWNPFLGIANQDDHGKGHASLTRGTEAGTDDTVDSISLVSVWHDDAVVLGSHVDLGTLAMSAGSRVDVLSSGVSSNEADALNVGVRADLCDSVTTTLDDIDDTIGDTRLLEQVNHHFGRRWHSLRRLEHEGVA